MRAILWYSAKFAQFSNYFGNDVRQKKTLLIMEYKTKECILIFLDNSLHMISSMKKRLTTKVRIKVPSEVYAKLNKLKDCIKKRFYDEIFQTRVRRYFQEETWTSRCWQHCFIWQHQFQFWLRRINYRRLNYPTSPAYRRYRQTK